MIIFSFFFLSFRYPHRWHRDDNNNNNNNNDDDGNLFGKSSLHASIIISFFVISFASSQHQHNENNNNNNDDDDDDGSVSKLSICAKNAFSEAQVGGKIHRCMEANSSMANSVSNLQLFTMIRIEINYNFSRNSSSSSSQHAYRFFSKH